MTLAVRVPRVPEYFTSTRDTYEPATGSPVNRSIGNVKQTQVAALYFLQY
jgi:hypothetical protein